MTLVLSQEQLDLSNAVRDFVDAKSTESDVRRLIDSDLGYDPAVWQSLCRLGIAGLAVPEEYGGSGGSFIELGLALEQAGRTLLAAPLLSSAVLATTAVRLIGDAAAWSVYLPSLAAGEKIGALAVAANDGSIDLEQPPILASGGDGLALSGQACFVIDAAIADVLFVPARTDHEVVLFAVPSDAPGVTITPLTTLDLTRRQARVEFANAQGTPIGTPAAAASQLPRVLQLGTVALAMEQLGGMQHVLTSAVTYAQDRYQFGRAIGSFQAIKHRCADMLMKVELARSAALYALWTAVYEPDALASAASLAKSYCSDAFFEVARSNILVLGGIGYTWEHSAHLYYRRAKADQVLFGTPAEHRARLLVYAGV